MTISSSDTFSIQQLWELSRWNGLVPPLNAALDDDRYSGQGLLVWCDAAIQVGRLFAARDLLRQALLAGVVTKEEAARFLIGGAYKSLVKARAELAPRDGAETGVSTALVDALPLSDVTRWYRAEGDPVVYVSNQHAESPLTKVNPECHKVIQRLQACSDRSLGSASLQEAVSASCYAELFSPNLADVLRPCSSQFDGLRVLVMDSQGGAQARFLAECGASVTAVASSPEHALISAALCADLPNVQVVLDTPHLVPFRGLYDLVVISVYQEVFLAKSEVLAPLDHLLKRAYSALLANGSLMLAGHNALALRHFNNQQDAYYREGADALEGRIGAESPQTLSSLAVQGALTRCGFGRQDRCAVMGTINCPRLLVSQRGCDLPPERWNLETLVRRSLREGDTNRIARFSESRVMQTIVKGGDLQSWSDGYLFWAHKSSEPLFSFEGWLASYFTRRATFSVRQERRFCLTPPDDEKIEVLTPSLSGSDGGKAEPYMIGVVYRDILEDLLQELGWTFEQVLQWSTVWLRCLLSSLNSKDLMSPERALVASYWGHYDLWVPEWLFRATPDRWIKAPSGGFTCLCKLGEPSAAVPMAAVLYTGLVDMFSTIRSVAEPADNTWLEPEALALAIVDRLGFTIDPRDIGMVWGEWQRVSHLPLPNAGYFQAREVPRALTDSAKLYWAIESEGFSENKTSICTLPLDGSVQTLKFPIASAEQRITALRFDVANRPGCFEIVEMSVIDAGGEVLWGWRHSRDELFNVQGACLVTDAEAGRSCILSRGNDPKLVLNVSETVLDAAAGGTFRVTLSAWPQRL